MRLTEALDKVLFVIVIIVVIVILILVILIVIVVVVVTLVALSCCAEALQDAALWCTLSLPLPIRLAGF